MTAAEVVVEAPSQAGRRRFAQKIGLTTVDQVLSAVSNQLIGLAVARVGGAEALGTTGIAFAVYLLVLGLVRSFASEPLLATRAAPGSRVDGADRAAMGVVLAVAVAGGLVIVPIGLFTGLPVLTLVGLAMPALMLQDLLRYMAFRRQQPMLAVIADGGWVLGSLVAWPVVMAAGPQHAATVGMGCWLTGAAFGALCGWLVLRPVPAGARACLRWWRHDVSRLSVPLILESLVVSASRQASLFVLLALTSVSALGVLGAGQVYFAPMGLMLTALAAVAVPWVLQRASGLSAATARRFSLAGAGVALVFGTAVVIGEPVLHRLLYAGSISVPLAVMLPLAVQLVATAAASGYVVVTKARFRGMDLLRSRVWSSLGGLALLAVATAQFGLPGAAWSYAAQSFWYLITLIWRVERAGQQSDAGRAVLDPGGER